MIDLMQRGQVISERNEKAGSDDSGTSSLSVRDDDDDDDNHPTTAPSPSEQQPATSHGGIDLHSLGNLFLGPVSRKLFDMAVMLHFISILISYVLAGM